MPFSNVYEHHQGPELSEFEPSKTKQEFLDESDINNIVSQYETNGLAPVGTDEQPIYGDFSDPALQNYHEAQNILLGAGQLFERLPARVRERFANDPAELILFVQDPNNHKEALELGLLNPEAKTASAPPPTPPDTP